MSNSDKIIGIEKDVEYIKSEITEIKREFVMKIEFDPVKKVIYGVIGVILMAFITAILTLVVVQK